MASNRTTLALCLEEPKGAQAATVAATATAQEQCLNSVHGVLCVHEASGEARCQCDKGFFHNALMFKQSDCAIKSATMQGLAIIIAAVQVVYLVSCIRRVYYTRTPDRPLGKSHLDTGVNWAVLGIIGFTLFNVTVGASIPPHSGLAMALFSLSCSGFYGALFSSVQSMLLAIESAAPKRRAALVPLQRIRTVLLPACSVLVFAIFLACSILFIICDAWASVSAFNHVTKAFLLSYAATAVLPLAVVELAGRRVDTIINGIMTFATPAQAQKATVTHVKLRRLKLTLRAGSLVTSFLCVFSVAYFAKGNSFPLGTYVLIGPTPYPILLCELVLRLAIAPKDNAVPTSVQVHPTANTANTLPTEGDS